MNASLTHVLLGRRKLKGQPPANAANPPAAEWVAAAIAHWPACGDVWVVLPPRDGEPARRVHLQVSIGALVRRKAQWVACFQEVDAPLGVTPVKWVLDSQGCLHRLEDAVALLRNRPDLVTRLVAEAQTREWVSEKGLGGRLSPPKPRDWLENATVGHSSTFARTISHAIL